MADGNILSGTQQAPIGSDKAYHTDGALDLFHSFAQLLTYIESNLSAVQNDIVPSADNSTSIGSATKRIKDIFQAGSIKDSGGNELLSFSPTASAVNEITIKNAATGNPPGIQATGGDTNIAINLIQKGTGGINIVGGANQAKLFASGGGTFIFGTSDDRAIQIQTNGTGQWNIYATQNSGAFVDASGTGGTVWIQNRQATGPQYVFTGELTSGFGRQAANKPSIYSSGAEISRFDSSGIDIRTGNLLRGGTQLLTAQQAAVADASGGAVVDTECRAQLNALLAKLRTHGLIAT